MEKDRKEKLDQNVNQIAEKLYLLRAQNGSGAEQSNLFSRLCEAVIQYIPVMEHKYNRLSADEIWDIVIDLLYYEFPADNREKWKPEHGRFAGCFLSLCNVRLKGACKDKSGSRDTDDQIDSHKNRKPDRFRLNPSTDAESGEENDPLTKIADPSALVDDAVQAQLTMKYFISLMNEEVRFKIKAAPKKFCYVRRFYTEWLSRQIMEPDFSNVLSLVSGVPVGCIDLQFASCFLDRNVSALDEISGRHLKKLSAFTGNDKDRSTPCGFDLKNAVYVSYVTAVTGKSVSDSIISNHRKNFYELLAMQSVKIGIGNHPITEN